VIQFRFTVTVKVLFVLLRSISIISGLLTLLKDKLTDNYSTGLNDV